MKEIKKKAVFNALGIIGILGGTTALVALGQWTPWTLILAIFACIPEMKYLWKFGMMMHRDSIRRVRKALDKIGFKIEQTEWSEDKDAVRLYGVYREDNFVVIASHSKAYVWIYDLPWFDVKSNDPEIPKMLEAINEINNDTPNMSVAMLEPDEKGIRRLHTATTTVLPIEADADYLGYLMTDMLNRKPAFVEAMRKPRPYMSQRRGTVGFHVEEPAEEAANAEEEALETAAKANPKGEVHA